MNRPSYAERMRQANLVTESAIRQAVASLSLAQGSAGLDAGCGIGLRTMCLAEAVGERGKVTGLDISPDHVAEARRLAEASPLKPRLEYVEGDIRHLPFDDTSFDWVWCVDTLWPGMIIEDPVDGVREFARVVKPGGAVALAYWTSQAFLPGYPELEARLDAAFAATTHYLAGVPARRQHLRALGWLEDAGLREPEARTFVAEVRHTTDAELRAAIAYMYEMFWGGLEEHLARADWDEYRRLCGLDSPDLILDERDYYGFLTYTIFVGRKPS